MLLDFRGHKLSKLQEQIIWSAASHALDYLVSKRMKNSLEITITIEKDLILEKNIWGDMMVDDDSRSPKLFEVRLSYSGASSFGVLIKALCHELVHVTQFATRRLRNLSGSYRVNFLNRYYTTIDVDYYDRPWEIEAHDLETKIYDYVLGKAKEIENYIQAKECGRFSIDVIPGNNV